MGKKNKVSIGWVYQNFIKPRRKVIFIGLVLIFLGRLAGIVLPYSSKYFLDNVLANKDYELLIDLVIIAVIALVIQSLTSFGLTRLLGIEAQRQIAIMRAKIQKKVLSLPVSFFDDNKSGSLVSRVMTDVEGIRNIIGTGLVQLIGGSLTVVVSFSILISVNIWLTIFVLVPMSLFAIISMKSFGYIRPIFRKRRELNAEVTGRLTETFNGIRVIKGFHAEKKEEDVFDKGVHNIYKNIKKSMTATAIVTSSSTFLLGLTTIGIMGIGGYQYIYHDLTSGEIFQFMFMLGFVIAPLVQMSNIGTQLTEAFAGLDRVKELLDMDIENDPKLRPINLENVVGDIKFDDVAFSYKENNEVIHNLSFDAPAGTVTALVGSSGSGKSTITGLIAAYLNPDSGKITIDGNDITKINLHSLRDQLGVVLQDDFLFEGTIRENILFAKGDATEKELEKAVKSAYVNEFTDRFEDGLDTLIGERGVKLSGGQRQRISIARALLADPKIIILDEATSNLDTESESFIQESLGELMQNRTTFVIAHRLSTIMKADQILVIENGEILERGNHHQLLEQKGRYYQLFTYQSRI